MSQLGTYDPSFFESLPSFVIAQGNLSWAEPHLASSAQVISDHGGDDRVGLALLHRHFSLERDELLVETVFPEARLSIGRPEKDPSPGDVVPHTFRAVRDGETWSWHPLEFVAAGRTCSASERTVSWLDQHDELLSHLADTLSAAGLLDVFGLTVNHGREDIECAEGEVLVESTDEQRRVLRMEPRSLSDVVGVTTPTNWSVRDGEVRMRCTCQRDQSGSHQHFETN